MDAALVCLFWSPLLVDLWTMNRENFGSEYHLGILIESAEISRSPVDISGPSGDST